MEKPSLWKRRFKGEEVFSLFLMLSLMYGQLCGKMIRCGKVQLQLKERVARSDSLHSNLWPCVLTDKDCSFSPSMSRASLQLGTKNLHQGEAGEGATVTVSFVGCAVFSDGRMPYYSTVCAEPLQYDRKHDSKIIDKRGQ